MADEKMSEGEKLGRELAMQMKAYVAAQVAPLLARIAELEGKKAMRFSGGWQKALSYSEGDCVTHGRSLFVCTTATRTAPPGDHWELAVRASQAK